MSLYDELVAGEKSAPATPNTAPAPVGGALYDALTAEESQQRALRGVLTATSKTTPERAAELNQLARVTGLPRAVVESQEGEAKARAQFQQLWDVSHDSPVLRARLLNPQFTELAKDDGHTLSAIERAIRGTAGSVWQFGRSVAAGAQGMPADLMYGTGRAASELVAPILDPLAGTVLPENPLRRMAAGFGKLQRDAQAFSRRVQGDVSHLGFLEGAINEGGRSLGGNLVSLPLGLAGGARAALAPLVGGEFGRSYGQARDRGLQPFEATAFGASQAAIEYATEKMPVARLLGDLKAGATLTRMLGHQVATEVPGEQIATLLQDLNEWAALNPDKSLRSFVDNYASPEVRASAAMQTLIATVVGVGGQTTVVKGIDSALKRFDGSQAKAQAAQQDAQALQALADLAGQSKVRERDAQAFEQFVKEANADGRLQEVFIPADTLAQALGPQLAAVAEQVPAVREQLDEALATGGLVAIPVEQFAAYVPSELAQSLVPHLRTAPDAMSLAEAQTFAQEGEQQLRAEVDELAGPTVEAQQAQQAANALEPVRAAISGLLEATGRFTPDVNSAYGELLAQFFQATAQRAGIDVQALFNELGPRIVSQLGQSAGQLDQSGTPDAQGAAPFASAPDGSAPAPGSASGIPGMVATLPASEADALQQGRRGAYDPATRTIALLSQADLSTFIHEAAHYFLEVQVELASRPGAAAQLQADMAALLRWFGVADLATWRGMSLEQKRPYHEQFARGFEAYAFEGEAPSQELRGVFQRFRSWLARVYRSISALNVQVSPEVRAVFHRMLATDQQIADAEAMRSYRPLFESAEAAGMTAEEWAQYQASGAQATADAVENLQRRSLRDMQWLANARARALSKLQRDAKHKRAAVQAEVTAEVNAVPIYAAWRDLARGKTEDGQPVRLSLLELKDNYPQLLEKLPAKTMAANEGLPLDMVAEAYGLDSGDQLVKLLTTLDHPDVVIEGQTDQRMLERYGDLVDERAIERAADEMIHNDARARFLEREVNAMGRAVGNRPVVGRAARQYAEEAIARKKVQQIRPAQYSAAEARAAKAAAQAFKKGDTATAAIRKREQLLQHQLARVAHRAVGEVERAVDYLRRFDTEATRKAIGPDYADQIDALLERFDFRRATTQKEIAKRKSLAEWVEQQREQGLEPTIDERLLTDASLTHFREMTLEDLRGLVDTVKNIEHLGRLKQKLLTVQDQRRFDELVTEAAQSIQKHGGKPKELQLEGRKGVRAWLQGVWASHRKISSLVRQMDGGKDNGPLWRILVRGMNEAGNREQVLTEQATMRLLDLYSQIGHLKGGITGAKVYIPEIRASLSRGGRLAVALNWGNATNRQRLMDGEGWSPAQVEAILATLTRPELDFVNRVWEFLDSYWPQIEAKQLRVTGLKMEKVEAEPFVRTLPDGSTVSMRGGYYPLKYDADRSSRAESLDAAEVAKDMMRGAFTRSTTRRGHTKARAEVVKRPIRKDLNVITEHVSQVVHDLSWHEWLMDANRLLGSKPIDAAIRTYYGPDVVRTLKDDLAGIASGDLVSQTAIDSALLTLRSNVSRSTMGFSFTTAMLQPFGVLQSVQRIGLRAVLRGFARWAGDATRLENSMAWIGEKSSFMRLRAKTFNRELGEIRGKVAGQSKFAQVRDGALFFMTTKLQMVADVPTWIGRYEQAVADGLDEKTAVALADQAVIDAQGSGMTKDLAEVQRRHPLLSQFYSYFSTTLNLAAEKTATTDFRNPRAVAGWLADMALLAVLPALGSSLALSILRGDDDDDIRKQLLQAQAGYLLGMLVGARELSGLVSGYPYNGPPVSRVVTDAGKAAGQVSQGEIDEPAVMAVVRLLGTAFGIPTTQAIRSYKGWKAWDEGQAPATSVLFGPPAKD